MAQIPISVRWGYSDGTSIKVVISSLSSSDVTIIIDGISSFVLSSMAAVGDDVPISGTEAFFADSTTVTGLSAFTKYTYTAIQDSNSVSGEFYSAPSASDDFTIFGVTCDNTLSIGGIAPGMYEHIKTYTESGVLPTVALIHIDDHLGYVDFNGTNDSAGTGNQITIANSFAWEAGTEYDYAVGAAASLGLYENDSDDFVAAGNNSIRQWCLLNIPVWPQWGDHDAGFNDIGWSSKPTDNVGIPPGGSATYLSCFTNAESLWGKILEPLAPPKIDGSNSKAWGANLGCLYVASPDAITTGAATTVGTNDAAPDTIFGNTQIDSLLSALDNDQPFKVLGLANGIRYLTGTPPHTGNDGAQLPLNLHATEYPRLFTDTGNAELSIMENPKTNGQVGTLFTIHGDNHVLKAQINENTDGTLPEQFCSFNMGTLTGSSNHDATAVGPAGATGTNVFYSEGTNIGDNKWCIRLDVYGSKSPKEVRVFLLDNTGAEVYSRKFAQYRTVNIGVDIDADVSLPVPSYPDNED